MRRSDSIRSVWPVLCLLFLMGFAPSAHSQSPAPEGQAQAIHITADKMVSEGKRRFAEFSGHVRAVRGSEIITCDRLQVYLGQSSSSDQQGDPAKDAIEKIIALDHVQIEFDDKTATTDKAVYDAAQRTIELIGPDSTVVQGKNKMTGSQIVIHLDEERISGQDVTMTVVPAEQQEQ